MFTNSIFSYFAASVLLAFIFGYFCTPAALGIITLFVMVDVFFCWMAHNDNLVNWDRSRLWDEIILAVVFVFTQWITLVIIKRHEILTALTPLINWAFR